MRNKRGSVFILLGLLLIVSSAGLSAYNLADAYYVGVQAQEALDALGFLLEKTTELPAYAAQSSAVVQKDLMGLPLPASTRAPETTQETMQTRETPVPSDASATSAPTAQEQPGQTQTNNPTPEVPSLEADSAGAQDDVQGSIPGLEFLPIDPDEIEIPDYILNPKMEMPVTKANGQSYIGVLEIPALGVTLPVISEWTYARLKKAPCRYAGSAYTDDLVIAAHNYREHFGKLKQLDPGSRVIFTDAVGNRFEYRVVLTETLMPDDVEEMKSGEFDLSLFTCTVGGSYRVTVRCDRLY